MTVGLLGQPALDWRALGVDLPPSVLRVVLTDVDGVITRGEGQAAELDVLKRLAATNAAAQTDPYVPAIALCTGRQAAYVELMAQMTATFLPCIFEHGAGMFFPATFRYQLDARLGPDDAARLARLRSVLDARLIDAGLAFVQPGKEASMTLFPASSTSVDELFALVEAAVNDTAPEFGVARNVNGVEVRRHGIDKGTGARRLGELLGLPLGAMAGVGDSDPDLSFLDLDGLGFSAAPANATLGVCENVDYVASAPFGSGLLEIVTLVESRNQRQL